MLGQQSKVAPSEVEKPLPTIATDGAISLIEPFLMNITHTARPKGYTSSVDEPAPTILTKQEHAVVQPFLVACNHGKDSSRSYDVNNPMPTITGVDAWGVIQPYLVKYNGTGLGAHSIDEPLDTISTKDRFGLCIPHLGAVLDIRFRMLQPHELAAAMSFLRLMYSRGIGSRE